MSTFVDPLEWKLVKISLAAVALVVVAVGVAWKVHDHLHPAPTRLERMVFCLKDNRGVVAVVPAGDPLADSAGDGSLKATIEGNDVTVALASSVQQAAKIAGYYRQVSGNMEGRLEQRGATVYLWRFSSSPTQREAMYLCDY